MRVLRDQSIYQCQSVKRRTYACHDKPNEFCIELLIALMPVQPLNQNITLRVTAYSEDEKIELDDAFDLLLSQGCANLNAFERVEEI